MDGQDSSTRTAISKTIEAKYKTLVSLEIKFRISEDTPVREELEDLSASGSATVVHRPCYVSAITGVIVRRFNQN